MTDDDRELIVSLFFVRMKSIEQIERLMGGKYEYNEIKFAIFKKIKERRK